MYRVRFHLARGEHYMHWQVRGNDGSVRYYDPNKYSLELCGCRLVNKINEAQRVHNAGVKNVCGWIECDNFYISDASEELHPIDNLERVRYNPIVDPHWRRDGDDNTFHWDDSRFDTLITEGNKVYILEETSYAYA